MSGGSAEVVFDLTDVEIERYARQLVMPDFGVSGQMKLKESSALVIGAGALGSVVAGYLAAAGVGRIGIVDGDAVDLSNLQRQLLFCDVDLGRSKADALADRLGALNTEVLVEPFPARVDEANALALLAGRDVVADCSDNFETRFTVNDASVRVGVPLVEAGILGLDGLLMTVLPGMSACYRCAFPEPPPPGAVPSCAEAGMLGPIAGTIGSLQALEAVKILTGLGDPAVDRVVQVEGRSISFTSVRVARRPECAGCGRDAGEE